MIAEVFFVPKIVDFHFSKRSSGRVDPSPRFSAQLSLRQQLQSLETWEQILGGFKMTRSMVKI